MERRFIRIAPSLKEPADFEGAFRALLAGFDELAPVLQHANTEYLYWDKFKEVSFPGGVSAEDAWRALLISRRLQSVKLPIKDIRGGQFVYWLPNSALKIINSIDTQTSSLFGPGSLNLDRPMLHELQISALMDEAIATSRIAGAEVAVREAKALLRFGGKPPAEYAATVNSYRALQEVIKLRNESLSPGLILYLHKLLMHGLMDSADSGRLRREGETALLIETTNKITHNPPPAKELLDRLELFCKFANETKHDQPFMHAIVKAIILHFWLAYDRPFVDGNGRMARILSYWYAISHGYRLFELLPVSKYHLLAKGQYGKAFLYAEQDGSDATYFITYHLKVISLALSDLQNAVKQRQRACKELPGMLGDDSALNYRQKTLIKHALENPGFIYTIESHQNSHGVTYPTARSDLLSLAQSGLLIKKNIGRKQYFSTPSDLGDRIFRQS